MDKNIPNARNIYNEIKLDCEACRRTMTNRHVDRFKIPADFYGQQISKNFAGPLRKQTKNKNLYFLLIIYNFSKHKMIWPCKRETAEVVLSYLEEWVKHHGRPLNIRADDANNIHVGEVSKFCQD